MKVKMKLDKETKGTHVWRATEDNPPIKTIYVAKGAVKGTPPSEITVEIKGL